MLVYLVSIYGFDNCDVHLGCFGLFSVFSIYVLVWGLLGGIGFIISSVLTKSSVKGKDLSLKYLATLGLLIGASHFIVQFNIENFLVMLPVPLFLSWLCSSVLYHLSERQV